MLVDLPNRIGMVVAWLRSFLGHGTERQSQDRSNERKVLHIEWKFWSFFVLKLRVECD